MSTTAITCYTVETTNGLAVPGAYSTREQAVAAIEAKLGWEGPVVGPRMSDAVGDDGEAEISWGVYEDVEAMDRDCDGTPAVRIVAGTAE